MRLIIRIISALLVTFAVLVAVLLLLPGEKIAGLAADQIEAQTGRKLAFGGKVRFTFWPVLGVKADGVTLSNAPWAGPEPLLTAERLTIGVAAADLLQGDVRVTEMSAILPHLNLAVNEQGTGNWVFDPPQAAASGPAAGGGANRKVSIESLALTGASLRYAAHGQAPLEAKNIELVLDWPDPAGTASLDLTLRPAGEPVRLTGEIGTFAAFLGGQVSSAGITVTAPGGSLRFDGRGATSGGATGRVTAKAQDLARMSAALGLGQLSFPRGLGKDAVLGADATYTPDGRLSLRDLALDLGGNMLKGAADLRLGAVPEFTARLTGGDLRLPELAAAGGQGGASGAAAAQGWSKTPISASALALANGTLDLSFNSLKSGAYSLGPSKLNLSLDRSRAVLQFQPAALFGGQVLGQLVANNRKGFSVAGNLNFTGIRLEQALGQVAGFSRLNGEAAGELEFLGAGSNVDAIMRSLSGKGWLETGKGFFTGFDLEELMRSGGNGGSTVFDRLTGSFTIDGGNLRNDDLLVTLKGFKAEGAGRVGLGAQDLDYLFTPTALALNGGRGLSIPVAITGPWSNPKIRPDLKRALEPQIDAVEERAKEQVRQKLTEELETEIAPEQDLNEVIKDRIEEEAKKQLLRLLQGN